MLDPHASHPVVVDDVDEAKRPLFALPQPRVDCKREHVAPRLGRRANEVLVLERGDGSDVLPRLRFALLRVDADLHVGGDVRREVAEAHALVEGGAKQVQEVLDRGGGAGAPRLRGRLGTELFHPDAHVAAGEVLEGQVAEALADEVGPALVVGDVGELVARAGAHVAIKRPFDGAAARRWQGGLRAAAVLLLVDLGGDLEAHGVVAAVERLRASADDNLAGLRVAELVDEAYPVGLAP